jgi:hypothetical protein
MTGAPVTGSLVLIALATLTSLAVQLSDWLKPLDLY